MQRTKHTAEFKAEAVKQVVDKGHTVVDVAARLGLSEGLLYTWVRKSKATDSTLQEVQTAPLYRWLVPKKSDAN